MSTSNNPPSFRMGQPDNGIKCPVCHCHDMRCYRTIRNQDKIVRIRVCRHCGKRVVTHESLPGGK